MGQERGLLKNLLCFWGCLMEGEQLDDLPALILHNNLHFC